MVDIFRAALGPIAYFITSELAAQRYRSLIQSIVFGINTTINFIFSFVTLPMYQWISAWSFVPLFIIPSIFSLVYLYFNLPETKGKEIHEIVSQMIQTERSRTNFRTRNHTSFSTLESSSTSDDDVDNGRPVLSYQDQRMRKDYSNTLVPFSCSVLPANGSLPETNIGVAF